MDALNKIKDLIEKMSVDTQKVYSKGNHSASIRARKYAQEIKLLIPVYRKELLGEMKKHEVIKKLKEETNKTIENTTND